MNDQMFRDVVSLMLIGTVVVLVSMGKTVDPQLKEWADVAFGFLFGFKTAGYTIGKQSDSSVSTTKIDSTITEVKP